MKRIKLLSPVVISQIAAGEVIERPASVVKEFLENSLDAEAQFIEVEIEAGGCKKIVVRDNGQGIVKEDLLLAVKAHSTSKINSAEDLHTVLTLGFRGEALASIASVSQLKLTSRAENETQAYKIEVHGGKIGQLSLSTSDQGTTLEVKDLFYNVPVRRKFLKSEKTEQLHVDSVIKRALLSRFEVAFKVKFDGKSIYAFSPAISDIQREKRLGKVLGSEFLTHALYFETETVGLKLEGWLCKPELRRKNSDWQYVYLNGRMVRDKLIQHAIKQAYGEWLESDYQPSYVLYLTIDPMRVDVNVHPTKHEVRFEESRYVHDFMVHAIRRILEKPQLTQVVETEPFPLKDSKQVELPLDLSSLPKGMPAAVQKPHKGLGEPLVQIYHRYGLLKAEKGFLLLDIKEVYLHQVQNTLQKGFLESEFKLFMIPMSLRVNAKVAPLIEERIDSFKAMGIGLESMGHDLFVLRKSLKCFQSMDYQVFLDCLSERLLEESTLSFQDIFLRALDVYLDENSSFFQESVMSNLLVYLESVGNPTKSFRNKPLWRTLSLSQIQSFLQ